jgi:three-Cys-motif partner protein
MISRNKMENNFFEHQSPSSRIKAKIVAEYFPKYCKILLKKPQCEIRYLDLFAGPGKYKDQNHSTPLLLANTCANDPILSQKVRLLFNDNTYSDQLKKNFCDQFPTGTFLFEPRFGDKTVGEDEVIKEYLTKKTPSPNPYPTLLFFDPWGYKGIDTLILSKFLSNWGNEIFLFVNIKRIHAAIENDKFDELMFSLFPTTFEKLKKDRKYTASVHQRLKLIMDNLASEFEKAVSGKLFTCAFKFQEEDSSATSHYILHITKHQKGYALVKQIYYDFDNIGAVLENDGNYTFDAKKMGNSVNSLFNFGDQNVASLSKILEEKYKGKTISAKDLFEDHHPSTKWSGSHYLKALRNMTDKGKIEPIYTDNIEHKVTVLLTNHCKLKFK